MCSRASSQTRVNATGAPAREKKSNAEFFRITDIDVYEGKIGGGKFRGAHASAGCGDPASDGIKGCAGDGADGNRQDPCVPDSSDGKAFEGKERAGSRRSGSGAHARAGDASGRSLRHAAREATGSGGRGGGWLV